MTDVMRTATVRCGQVFLSDLPGTTVRGGYGGLRGDRFHLCIAYQEEHHHALESPRTGARRPVHLRPRRTVDRAGARVRLGVRTDLDLSERQPLYRRSEQQ